MGQNPLSKIDELEKQILQLKEENKRLRSFSEKNQKENNIKVIERLKESEERYILSQTLAQIGSWEKKKDTDKIWVSDDMLTLLGIEKVTNYLLIDQILECIHSEDRSKLISAFEDLNDKNKNFDLEVKVIKPQKDEKELKFIQFVSLILKDENNHIDKTIGIVKDITNLKRIIKDLTRAKEKAEDSDRLKTAFLANMSHDLRTPMNAIIGYSELLNLSNTNPQNRKEYSKIIKQKGLQLLTLIDDIIEVSKFETAIPEISKTEFNLHDLLNEVKNIYNDKKFELGKENISINLILPENDGNLVVYTDSGRLQQVFGNLINNALKYTEKGYIEFGYTIEEDSRLKFYVKDTGIGISKEKQKYIFNRFKSIEKTTRLKYTGSGLGLTLSKRIVDLLGGKIWVESEENKGSVFYFTLTLGKTEDEKSKEKIAENKDISRYNWKDKVVLIVEDEEINYKFLETVLHDTKAQILYARDGMQAIDLCLSINKIDMILMDIKMPEIDGYEATKRIKQIRPEIPIIAQTAFASHDDKINSLRSGCDDYISKPIEIELLISKINKFFIEKDYY